MTWSRAREASKAVLANAQTAVARVQKRDREGEGARYRKAPNEADLQEAAVGVYQPQRVWSAAVVSALGVADAPRRLTSSSSSCRYSSSSSSSVGILLHCWHRPSLLALS